MNKTTQEVNDFINSLDDAQRGYITHCLKLSSVASDLINKFKIDKEVFCDKMGIVITQYDAFVQGGYNYDLEAISKMESLRSELELLEAEELISAQAILQFPKYKYSKKL